MKEGWEYKKLGDCCNIDYGTRVVQKKDGGTIYPVYGGGGETFRMDKYNREDCLIIARFAMSKTCVRYVSGKFFLNDSGLSVTAGDGLSQKYLNHHFVWYNDDIYNLGKGAAQRNLDVKAFKNLTIAIPPLSTQQSIVAELDEINNLLNLKKKELETYDKLAQSLFYEMFGDPVDNEKGWEEKKLGEVCTKITDGTHDTPQRLNSGIKFITGKHIRPGFIDYDNSDYVTKEVHKEIFARCNPEYGDVLYTNIGANLANAAMNIVDYEFSMKNVALFKLSKEKINGKVLEYYLNNEFIKRNILENFSNGGAQKFLSLKSLYLIKVILPPLSLQQTFAARIEAIEEQKANVKAAIEKLETLLASRMQFWFE